eukprot:14025447-Alexandrium_andersonii.AAC.1
MGEGRCCKFESELFWIKNPAYDGQDTGPVLLPLHHVCRFMCGVLAEADEAEAAGRRKANVAKVKAELEEGKETRLMRQQQAELQQQ